MRSSGRRGTLKGRISDLSDHLKAIGRRVGRARLGDALAHAHFLVALPLAFFPLRAAVEVSDFARHR